MIEDYVTIGQLLRARGTKGEVDVLSLTDFPERFAVGLRVFLIPPLPDKRELVIKAVGHQPKRLVLAFEGIETRSEIEKLRGRYIAVPPEEVAELPADSYWIDDLIGLEVVTAAGETIGTVKEVIQGTAHDVYVVAGPEGEKLVPAVAEVVKEIDIENGKILIEPLPGLLD
ncbi:MAG: ribosome maturation factor RimM [Candidatus Aquicultorales bacterium]